MQHVKDNDTFIIHVQQNEKIMSNLTQFCKDHKINNGQISGIGAIKGIKLGAYVLENKKCIIKHFNEI